MIFVLNNFVHIIQYLLDFRFVIQTKYHLIYHHLMTTADYKKIASSIPLLPGVYQYISPSGEILYVGKAKQLRKRLASYFGSQKGRSFKVKSLVKNAEKIIYTIVETEQDALLLENTLIKSFSRDTMSC